MTAQISDTIKYKGSVFDLLAIKGDNWFNPKQYLLKPVYRMTSCYRGFCASYRIEKNLLYLDTLDINLCSIDNKSENGANLIGLESLLEENSKEVETFSQKQIDIVNEDSTFISPTERLLELIRNSEDNEDYINRVKVQAPNIEGRSAEYTRERGGSFDYRYENMQLPISFSGGILVGRSFIKSLYVHMGYHPPWKFRTVQELTFLKGRLLSDRNQSQVMTKIRLELVPDYLERSLFEKYSRDLPDFLTERCFNEYLKNTAFKINKKTWLIQKLWNLKIRLYTATVSRRSLKSLIEKYDIDIEMHNDLE